jgi:hypothetical protein
LIHQSVILFWQVTVRFLIVLDMKNAQRTPPSGGVDIVLRSKRPSAVNQAAECRPGSSSK